jgi:hypothetical protein
LQGLIALACLATLDAHAGGTISFGEDKSVSIGLGMRTSLTRMDDGTDTTTDFSLDSIRLYMGASLNKYIKGTFNTEKASDDSVKVIDAIAQFEFSDGFNIWAGRMLPPSDRANLDGPYYMFAWYYPGVVSQYPNRLVGRDDGATVWGKLLDKKLVYAVGAFEGHDRHILGGSDSHLLYAGRVQYSFWDPDPAPAYYTGSTYFGGAEILDLAVAGMFETDGVVNGIGQKGDYTGYNADALLEHKLGGGVATLEGAYYKYESSDLIDVGGITQGKGWLAGAAYLIPAQIGWGKFQPYVRYQHFDADLTNITSKQTDIGLNYIIDGHNARLSATYAKNEATAAPDVKSFVVGLQLQF